MDDYYAEPSADEIFSGPTHELVPSSYSSFHRNHWPHHEEEEPSRDRRSSFYSTRSRRLSDASRVSFASGVESDEESHFNFFSRDEIEQADGASTVFGDDDSVHSGSDLSLHSFGSNGSTNEPANAESDGLHPQFSTSSVPKSNRTQQRYYIAEEDMRIFCAGYSVVFWRLQLWNLLCILSGGVLYLLGRWFPRQRLFVVANQRPLGLCEFLVVENQWGELEQAEVKVERYNHPLSTVFPLQQKASTEDDNSSVYFDSDPNVLELRTFTYRYIRFLYHPLNDMFLTNSGWVSPLWGTVEGAATGLDGEEQSKREQVFGRNSLEIAQPSIPKLLIDEVLHPFYIFQLLSVVLWLLDEYVYYAAAILLISVLSVAEALSETRKGHKRLAEIAHNATTSEIHVLRSGFWRTVPNEELVPGDVYELSDPALTHIPVDSLLLSGDCILNESILTGESVPVRKQPCTDAVLAKFVASGNTDAISRHFVYSGTRIIQLRKPDSSGGGFEPALAMVVRIGFSTTKGSLVRSMMFPKPSGFKFYRDSFRYIGVMAVVALFGFVFSAVNFVRLGMPVSMIILRALDIITVVVPPALPATLTIGTNFSLQRLRKQQIFCITPSRVNVGGRVNCCVFDKTGTLTEEGLDVLGVHLVRKNHHKKLKFGKLLKTSSELENNESTELRDTLVTCHELDLVAGNLLGDPLDLKMFEFTGWHYDQPRRRFVPESGKEVLHVYKQFEFVPALRRMSVVASGPDGTRVLAKGAPEIMEQICLPESIPTNFQDVLHEYTHRGFRVIACAWRDVGDIVDYDRTELEQNLHFAGLIVFENKLKPQSRSAIKGLRAAGSRVMMCTGDNVLTAISVGRECGIVPRLPVFAGHIDINGELEWEGVDDMSQKLDGKTLKPLNFSQQGHFSLAVTGDVFSHIIENHLYEVLEQVLVHGVVFARMSPDEKHELVSQLQQIGYTTLFCGDGANDCGALKAADVGVSLSEAEASVAAPFTSKRFDISCVLDVLAEGRCALTTSFGCFKYMSMYSAIQFTTVTILYAYGTNIGDFQFLYIDLFLIVPIAAFMAWSSPARTLASKRPGAELVSRKVLVPLLFGMAVMAGAQIAAWRLVHLADFKWYISPIPGSTDDLHSSDNTVLFFASSFQYILAGVLFCDGLPFRMPVSTNKPFVLTVALALALSVAFMVINPLSSVGKLMDLTYTPHWVGVAVVGVVSANYGCLRLADQYLYGPVCRLLKRKTAKPRYKELLDEVSV